ncbi:MAG: class I SAM-dependent methyltransferase [Saprospiraceae bacterium]|nr:methyltransferase [Lewinellaceae bacterium]
MPNTGLLPHYTTLHAAYLHAEGERGTDYLLEQLPLQGNEHVLEFGFGTGATLVKLKSRLPNLALSGLEADPEMRAAAAARLRFCRLAGQIDLLLQPDRDRIPKGSLDLVYAESVLAILDEPSFADALHFIAATLKTGGVLAVNESIWRSAVTLSEIDAINAHCREKFGIIQCSAAMTGLKATVKLFENSGFSLLSATHIPPGWRPDRNHKPFREYLSRLFTVQGKSRLLFQPRLRKQHAQFSADMGALFTPGREYLRGAVLLLRKTAAV